MHKICTQFNEPICMNTHVTHCVHCTEDSLSNADQPWDKIKWSEDQKS